MCRLFFHHHHHHQTRIVWFIKPASWRICASRCVCVFVCTPITHSLRQCCLLLCLLPNPFCFPFCWCQSGGCIVFAWIFLCLFWSISIGQIELVSSGRHARGTGTCSGLYTAQPSGNVLLKLLFSSARDAKDASSPADLPCLRLFRLFIYLSFSLTAFCLQENDRLSLPLCFVASFFICNSLSLTLILAYSFPSFSCHSSQLPSAMCFLPSGTELHLHHLSLFFCKRMALFILLLIAYLTGKVVHFINRHLHLKEVQLLLRTTGSGRKWKAVASSSNRLLHLQVLFKLLICVLSQLTVI